MTFMKRRRDDPPEPAAPEPPGEVLDGAQYVAVRRLSTADDETLADVGETCDRVPASSLPWLLADGLIEQLVPAAAPPVQPADDEGKG